MYFQPFQGVEKFSPYVGMEWILLLGENQITHLLIHLVQREIGFPVKRVPSSNVVLNYLDWLIKMSFTQVLHYSSYLVVKKLMLGYYVLSIPRI